MTILVSSVGNLICLTQPWNVWNRWSLFYFDAFWFMSQNKNTESAEI